MRNNLSALTEAKTRFRYDQMIGITETPGRLQPNQAVEIAEIRAGNRTDGVSELT